MDWQTFFPSMTLSEMVFGLICGIALIVALFLWRNRLAQAISWVMQRLFSQIGFFSLVIVVFLLISVLSSGEFFNGAITHGE